MRSVLADFLPLLDEIQRPGTPDGGDICEAGGHFFIGISERTNGGGARQFAEILASFNYTSCFVDVRGVDGILHLKSGLGYLGDNRLAVIERLAARKEFAAYDLIRVNDDDMYAANCVRVNDHVLVAAGHPVFERTLSELGYQTISLDMTEFQKLDGGLSC